MRKKETTFIFVILILLNSHNPSGTVAQEDKSEFQRGILMYTVNFNRTYNFMSPDIQSISIFFNLTRSQEGKNVILVVEDLKSDEIGFHNLLNRENPKYSVANELLTNNANDKLDFDFLGKTINEEQFHFNQDGTEFTWMVPQRDIKGFVLNSINIDIVHVAIKNLGYSTDVSIDVIWEFWVQPTPENLADRTPIKVSAEEESSILLLSFPLFSVTFAFIFLIITFRNLKVNKENR